MLSVTKTATVIRGILGCEKHSLTPIDALKISTSMHLYKKKRGKKSSHILRLEKGQLTFFS